jgi:hypothetical protein
VRSTTGGERATLLAAGVLMTLGLVGFIFLLAAISSGQVAKVEGASTPATTTSTRLAPYDSDMEYLGYSDKLDDVSYESAKVGGISGLAYDPHENLYYAVVDREAWDIPARFYTLHLPMNHGRLDEPHILDSTLLRGPSGQPYTGKNFDGEGIDVARNGDLFVASEREPSIRRFSVEGRFLAQLPVPGKFRVVPERRTRRNGSFESLSTSPNGRSLFTAPQYPLSIDGRSSTGAQRIRLLRYEEREKTGFRPSEEFFYLTEPSHSVTDVVALSERELLVLEGPLIYRVRVDDAKDVSGEKSLATSEAAPVKKELLVDLDDCPVPNGAEDRDAFFEGLELGENLPKGRQELVTISDDNFDSEAKTRLIMLGLRLSTSGSQPGSPPC